MRQAVVEKLGEFVAPLSYREPHPQITGAIKRAIEKIPPQPAQAAAIASDIGARVGLHQCADQRVIARIWISFMATLDARMDTGSSVVRNMFMRISPSDTPVASLGKSP